MKYDVRITDTREVIVSVEAGSMAEAKVKAKQNDIEGMYADEFNTTRFKRTDYATLYPNYSIDESKWRQTDHAAR